MAAITLLAVPFAAALVLGLAAVLKMADPRWPRDQHLAGFGEVARAVAIVTACGELGLAVWLLLDPAGAAPLLAATGTFGVFWVALLRARHAGDDRSCGCFGELSAGPPGRIHLSVVGTLAGALACVTLIESTASRGASAVADPAYLLAGWASIGTLSTMALVRLRRHHVNESGAQLRRGGSHSAPPAPPLGQVAVRGLDGEIRPLDVLYGRRRAIVAIIDPHCGPCQSVVDKLAMAQHSGADDILVVSRGSVEENRAWAAERDLRIDGLQDRFEVAEALGVAGTPAIVEVSSTGQVISRHLGRAAIGQVLEERYLRTSAASG